MMHEGNLTQQGRGDCVDLTTTTLLDIGNQQRAKQKSKVPPQVDAAVVHAPPAVISIVLASTTVVL